MYMKSKKKLKIYDSVWDKALKSFQTRKKCICGQLLDDCDEAYSHMTRGY